MAKPTSIIRYDTEVYAKVSKAIAARLAALTASLLLLTGLVIMATGVTGAYFSDTKHGEFKGNTGSIRIHTTGGSGADNLLFNFENLLPGEPQSATIEYTNTGRNKQDVWVVFNNAEALHALNNLGTYGEVTLSNPSGWLFHSTNLNDNLPPASGTCGTFSESGCWPLQKQYKVGSNVSPGAGSWFRFTFAYASKLKSEAAEEQPWNTYPPEVAPDKIVGNGLPYEVVATQVGVTP